MNRFNIFWSSEFDLNRSLWWFFGMDMVEAAGMVIVVGTITYFNFRDLSGEFGLDQSLEWFLDLIW